MPKTDDITRKPASRKHCRGCEQPFGAKTLPVIAEAPDGTDEEVWCPRCFVYVRATKEPGRFYGARPIHCLDCDRQRMVRVSPAAMGPAKCINCGSLQTVLLPPVTQAS